MTQAETLEQALQRIDNQLVKAETLWASYVALASKRKARALAPEYGASKFDALIAEKAHVLERFSRTRKSEHRSHYGAP
jgi:hypothetical protein